MPKGFGVVFKRAILKISFQEARGRDDNMITGLARKKPEEKKS